MAEEKDKQNKDLTGGAENPSEQTVNGKPSQGSNPNPTSTKTNTAPQKGTTTPTTPNPATTTQAPAPKTTTTGSDKEPRMQSIGDFQFDSNKLEPIKTDLYTNFFIYRDPKTGKDQGIIRKKDGTYVFNNFENRKNFLEAKGPKMETLGHIKFNPLEERVSEHPDFSNIYTVTDVVSGKDFNVIKKKDGTYAFQDPKNADFLEWKEGRNPNVPSANVLDPESFKVSPLLETKTKQKALVQGGAYAKSDFPYPDKPNILKLGDAEFDVTALEYTGDKSGFTNTYRATNLKTGKHFEVFQNKDGTYKFVSEQTKKDYGIPHGRDYAYAELTGDKDFEAKLNEKAKELKEVESKLNAVDAKLTQQFGADWSTRSKQYSATYKELSARINANNAKFKSQADELNSRDKELSARKAEIEKKDKYYASLYAPLTKERQQLDAEIQKLTQDIELAKKSGVGQGMIATLSAKLKTAITKYNANGAEIEGINAQVENDKEYKTAVEKWDADLNKLKQDYESHNKALNAALSPEERARYKEAASFLEKMQKDPAFAERNKYIEQYETVLGRYKDISSARNRFLQRLNRDIAEDTLNSAEVHSFYVHRQAFANLPPEQRKEIAELARKGDDWYHKAKQYGIDPKYVPVSTVDVPDEAKRKIDAFLAKEYPGVSDREKEQLQTGFATMYRTNRNKFNTYINPQLTQSDREKAEFLDDLVMSGITFGASRLVDPAMELLGFNTRKDDTKVDLTDTTLLNLRREALLAAKKEISIDVSLMERQVTSDENMYTEYRDKLGQLAQFEYLKTQEKIRTGGDGTVSSRIKFLETLSPEEREFYMNFDYGKLLAESDPVIAEAVRAKGTEMVVHQQALDAIKDYPELHLAAIKSEKEMKELTIQEGDDFMTKVVKQGKATSFAAFNALYRGASDIGSFISTIGSLGYKAAVGREGLTGSQEDIVLASQLLDPIFKMAELDPSKSFKVKFNEKGDIELENAQYALPELAGTLATMAVQILMTRGMGGAMSAAGVGVRAAQTSSTIATTFLLGFAGDYQNALAQGLSSRDALGYTTAVGLLKGAAETINIEGLTSIFSSKTAPKMFSQFMANASGTYGQRLGQFFIHSAKQGVQEVPEELVATLVEGISNSVANMAMGTNFEVDLSTETFLKTALMAQASGTIMAGIRQALPGNAATERNMALAESAEYLMENQEDFQQHLADMVDKGEITSAYADEVFQYVSNYNTAVMENRTAEREKMLEQGLDVKQEDQPLVRRETPPVSPIEFAMRGDKMESGELVDVDGKEFKVEQTADGPVLVEKAKDLDPEDAGEISTAYDVEVEQTRDGKVRVRPARQKRADRMQQQADTPAPSAPTATPSAPAQAAQQTDQAPSPTPTKAEDAQVEKAKQVLARRGYAVEGMQQDQKAEEGDNYTPIAGKTRLSQDDANELGRRPKGDRTEVPLSSANAVVYKGDEFTVIDKNPDGSYELENYSGSVRLSGIPATDLKGVKVTPFQEVSIGKVPYKAPAEKINRANSIKNFHRQVKRRLLGGKDQPTAKDTEAAKELEIYTRSMMLAAVGAKDPDVPEINQTVENGGRVGKVTKIGKAPNGDIYAEVTTSDGEVFSSKVKDLNQVEPDSIKAYKQELMDAMKVKNVSFKSSDGTLETDAKKFFASQIGNRRSDVRNGLTQIDLIKQAAKFLKNMGLDIDIEVHTTLEGAKAAAIKAGGNRRNISSFMFNGMRVYDRIDNGDGTSTVTDPTGERVIVPSNLLTPTKFGGVIVESGPPQNKQTIIYSLPNMIDSTAAHEVFHPVIDLMVKNNPEIVNKFFNEIKNTPEYEQQDSIGRTLREFIEQYDSGERAEEALVEFVARIASNKFQFQKRSTSFKAKVVRFFKKLFGDVGAPVEINTNNVVKFAQGLATAFAEGRAISNIGPPEQAQQPKVNTKFIPQQKKVAPPRPRTIEELIQAGEAEFVNSKGKPCA